MQYAHPHSQTTLVSSLVLSTTNQWGIVCAADVGTIPRVHDCQRVKGFLAPKRPRTILGICRRGSNLGPTGHRLPFGSRLRSERPKIGQSSMRLHLVQCEAGENERRRQRATACCHTINIPCPQAFHFGKHPSTAQLSKCLDIKSESTMCLKPTSDRRRRGNCH
jgi:hypothetical protein